MKILKSAEFYIIPNIEEINDSTFENGIETKEKGVIFEWLWIAIEVIY